MENQQAGKNLTKPTANMRAGLVQERSTEDLTQAIRLPGDEEYVLNRTRDVLKLYYDPQMSDENRAAMLDEFGKALRDLPRWVVAHAFDRWVKSRGRRPAPGEIVELAETELKRYSDVIKVRRFEAERNAPVPEYEKIPAEETQAILDKAGFTLKRAMQVKKHRMATTLDELEQEEPPRPLHWTEKVDPDGPEMAALRKEREGYKVQSANSS